MTASAKLSGINVVVLFVADLDRAKTFYRDTLGLEIGDEDPQSVMFSLGSVMLLLIANSAGQDLLGDDAIATSRPSGTTFQLVSFVEDVDALFTDLSAKGVEFVTQPVDQPWGLRTAHFKDPEGNVWELAQPVR